MTLSTVQTAMTAFIIILSVLLWLGALAALFRRQLYAPALGYFGLLCLSFARQGGYPLLPISGSMLWGWLAITVVVMMAVVLQPATVRADNRGMGYMTGGALTGLAVGLLGFTFSYDIGMLYAVMIVAVAAGVFFGFLLYSRTPRGVAFTPSSGMFFRYLLAKGFPTAITVMQMGIAFVLAIALNKFVNP